ncbi:MAG: alpha/beta fold hydrolase [Aquisalimonadaceae bacterium]
MDQWRRLGGLALDVAGLGPQRTPFRVLFATRGVKLLSYPEPDANAPALLLVPAPIKHSYIWDLCPKCSVVRHALRAGFRVYLLDWLEPGPEEQGFGFDMYADRLIRECVARIAEAADQERVFLAGHSLGGVFAAIFSALYPQRVRGLALLEAPLEFERHGGPLKALVDASPPTDWLTVMPDGVPGAMLSAAGAIAAPNVFIGERLLDWWCSQGQLEAMQTHLRVMRWTMDEIPMSGRLLADVVERLYRRNLFLLGRLSVNGRLAKPANIIAPVVSVVNPVSRVIPQGSILQFHQVIASNERRVLYYPGDIGVALQHVGVLVGRYTHRYIWPIILQWFHAIACEPRLATGHAAKPALHGNTSVSP